MGCWEKLLGLIGLRRPYSGEFREIFLNHRPLRSGQTLTEEKYPSNLITTSRYTVLTFLVQNLLEQFSRVANFYFLIVAVVQLVSDTPVSPATSLIPLLIVLGVTAVKQAYEDVLRHRADDRVNNTPVQVIRAGGLQTLKAHEIRVGDIVRVAKNDSFPCDLLLLSSSEPSGECSITTANLDGETNLKVIYSVDGTKELREPAEMNAKLRGQVSCEQPTADLYKFKGNLLLRGAGSLPLSAKNMLLRGAVLRNTDYVLAAAVYTGRDTKMQLNSQRGRAKKSVIEKKLDKFLLFFMLILLAMALFCTSMKWVYATTDSAITGAWYLPPEAATPWRIVEDFLGFTVLFNYLIPISLYVTIELQKFLGSIFFEQDLEMYWEDPDTGERFRAKANTSDLNEELGQVQYLFSDKTGTLTENKMTFRQCCIGSQAYCDNDGRLFRSDAGQPVAECRGLSEEEELFFTVLALCHTIRVERPHRPGRQRQYSLEEAEEYAYQASSPDEKAFVEACRNYGIVFHGTEENESILTVGGSQRRYRVLEVLEFDSDRKCMSVIVQRQDGAYWLLTKGAESSMLEKCVAGDKDAAIRFSAEFAVEGLRVLVIAHRQLSPDEYHRMSQELLEANRDVANRESRTVEAYKSVEQELVALGCTAIEDELQTGVRETITDLRLAGIQVWILTGDKRETAENISLSAGHFTEAMTRIRIVEQETADGCQSAVRRGLEETEAAPGTESCVIVDGQSLRQLVAGDSQSELKGDFLSLCRRSAAVLCCRCTPLQKARVVAMVKEGIVPKPVTCAVGDGANDVSMIREAHVGVGLYGKEGRAAALNADYALARFQFLRKALLFHGHLYYVRLATLVQYFFYKNVAFITACFLYSFYTGFSAQSLYEPVFLTVYNITMTSLPVLLLGLFELHVHRQRLYEEPQIYKNIAGNCRLWWSQLLQWCLLGLWHCLCCTFGVLVVMQVNDTVGTFSYDLFDFGSVVVQCVLVCVTVRIHFVTFSFNAPLFIGLAVTVLGFVLVMSVYNIVQTPLLAENAYFYWSYFDTMSQPTTWLLLLAVPALALTPDFALRAIRDSAMQREIRRGRAARCLPESNEAVVMETKNGARTSGGGGGGFENRAFASA